MSVCILHGPGAEKSVVQRAFKALRGHKVDAWEADRDGPVSAITSRLKDTTLILTLGGDGTFLAGGRLAAPRGILLLGVNLGRLGFLADLTPEAFLLRLGDLAERRYTIEQRIVLRIGRLWYALKPLPPQFCVVVVAIAF